MRECFLGNILPLPTTTEVIAAWKDLPNITTDNLPMCMKTGLVFLRAPPPTPTGLAFDTDGATLSDSSFNGSHDRGDGWLLVDDTTLPTPDVVALEDSATSEDDSMSRCSYPDQSLDRQINEEDPFQSTDSNSLSSDPESLSSSGGTSPGSPTPVGFHNMVNQWLLDYRARGTDPFIESLIAFGVVSVGTALLAARVARAIIRKVAKISRMEGRSLEKTIRFSAMAAFKKCWESVSRYCRLLSSRLGQQCGEYRMIPGWRCQPLRRIPACHPLHMVSILPA